MNKRQFFLVHAEARRRAAAWVANEAPEGWMIEGREITRTLAQNAAQWPYLDGFSEQLTWPVNGRMCTLTPEEWKDILTAGFHGDTVRLAAGLNGGVVMLGRQTSKMLKGEFSEWMEFLIATAAQRGVTPVYKSQPRLDA